MAATAPETIRAAPAGASPAEREAIGKAARAHARSGNRIAIAAYLGGGDRFDQALARFADAYADQNERDFDALSEAAKTGRVVVETEDSPGKGA